MKKFLCNKTLTVELLFFIILIIYGGYDIAKFSIPLIAVDDIGYWSTAYYYAFGQIKEVASGLSYYAYGYSIFLSLLVRLIHDGAILFRIILVLNTFYVAISYLCLIHIFGTLYKEISKVWISFFAFVAMMYVSNHAYSKHMLVENFVTLCLLLLVVLIVDVIEKYSFSKLLLATVLCIFMHFVHQRTIAIVAAYILLFIVMVMKEKIPVHHAAIIAIIAAIFWGLCSWEKQLVINNIYGSADLVAINDYSANASKIAGLFSWSSFGYFVLSVCGKLGYFIFSSFILNFLGVISYFESVFKYIVRGDKNERTKGLVGIFLCSGSIFIIGVAAVFMYGNLGNRYEIAMYGRYMEYIYSVLMVNGLIYLFRNINKRQVITGAVLLMFVCLLGIEVQFAIDNPGYGGSWLTPGVHLFFDKDIEVIDSIKIMRKMFLFYLPILYLIGGTQINVKVKKCLLIVFCVGAVIYWGENYSILKNEFLKEQTLYVDNCKEISEIVKEKALPVYYSVHDEYAVRKIRQLQFDCPDIVFHNVETYDKKIIGEALYIYETDGNSIRDLTKIVYENELFICGYN